MNKKSNELPARHECPERFCFFWVPAGGRKDLSGGVYESVDEALREAEMVVFEDAGCGCTFGLCSRSGKPGEGTDWYEPCEPELDKAGLPHHYFCGSSCDKRGE